MVKAINKNGVFEPTEPVHFDEGTVVDVSKSFQEVKKSDLDDELNSGQGIAQLLKEIASMEIQNPTPCSGRDHDKILYGKK